MFFRGQLRPLTLVAGATLALLTTFALVACSDNNDKPAATTTPTTATTATASASTATATATAAASASAAAAGATPTNADMAYAKQLCTSLNNYLNDFLTKASEDPGLLTDQSKILKLAGPAISSLGEELKKATPPPDVKQYHDELVAKTREVSQKLQDGSIKSLVEIANVTADIKPPPKNVEDRLQAAANQTKECQDSLLAGSLFGG